jgi:5-formyltetrahydrofolate cyclo-ligase
MNSKGELRREFRTRLREIAPAERRRSEAAIRASVLNLDEIARAEHVLSYVSVSPEVDTRGIVEHLLHRGVRVFAPRMGRDCDTLQWGAVDSLGALVRGPTGLLQPPENAPADYPARAPVLVPCVAFTAGGDRLGRGGGHFDRFLADHAGKRIGIAFECQRAEALPLEPHDVRLDAIVTEARICRVGAA